MQKVDINSLILDYGLYPRNSVDSQHANYMVESLMAGIELPPVVADRKSKRIVDGFHRILAWRRYYSRMKIDNMSVPVIFKQYGTDKDIFEDAMRYNSAHGRMFTQYDRAHCIIRAEELSLSKEAVCKALSITPVKYDDLKAERIGKLHLSPHLDKEKKKRHGSFHGTYIPLKRTIGHMAGKELTEGQVEANKKFSGMEQSFYVNQLIGLIENDLLDSGNGYLMIRLEHLQSLLQDIFKKANEAYVA